MNKQNPFDFGQLLQGFNFLSGTPGAGPASALGGGPLGHWIAPTVDVDELERRISELKAVQFWLDQNQIGVKATIQALEVQKMTLATLRGMNLNVAEVAKAFTIPAGAAATAAAKVQPAAPARPAAAGKEGAADASGKPMLDPMQWWGALTQQFQQIATQTMQEATRAADAARADATAAVNAATEQVAGKVAAAAAGASGAKAAPVKKAAAAKPAARRGAAAKKKPASRGKK